MHIVSLRDTTRAVQIQAGVMRKKHIKNVKHRLMVVQNNTETRKSQLCSLQLKFMVIYYKHLNDCLNLIYRIASDKMSSLFLHSSEAVI